MVMIMARTSAPRPWTMPALETGKQLARQERTSCTRDQGLDDSEASSSDCGTYSRWTSPLISFTAGGRRKPRTLAKLLRTSYWNETEPALLPAKAGPSIRSPVIWVHQMLPKQTARLRSGDPLDSFN